MFLDISKRLKLKPDQEEKFLVIFTRDKDDFVARRKKEKWSPQEESKQLGDTFKKMISDSKDILTKEQYATLRHLFATVY